MDIPYTLHLGDCLEVLRTIPDNSIDSVVTDPPYGLAFMGKRWDYDVPSVEIWAECLRVLKPGGHLLAFAGTRTQHRMACRIEDAGFEIRDMIAWVYGSGFPKSMDVSKAIDKAGGASPRELAELLRKRREAAGMSRELVAQYVGCTPASVRDWEEGRARAVGRPIEFIVPSEDYRERLADLLGYSADERKLIGTDTDRRGDGTVYGIGHSGERRLGGNTEAAARWSGWGTALKPALEPITMARKPLNGTVAANVLAHCTGALHIDACRIPAGLMPANTGSGGLPRRREDEQRGPGMVAQPHAEGRWPANLIHDGSDEVLAAFPDAPGQRADVSTTAPSPKTSNVYGRMSREGEASADSDNAGVVGFKMKPGARRMDGGSSARFFYCAKANKNDRGDGNAHPTVKPTELMAYLCRLVTRPGGKVLDPFMGSGSTGKACMREGFQFTGIEREALYLAIAEARISHALDRAEAVAEEAIAGAAQLDIFNDTKEPAA